MAITPSDSAQYANIAATPPVLNDGRDHGKLRMAHAVLTYTAGGTGQARMLRLPAGKIRIYPILGRTANSVNAVATSTISVGLGAYVTPAGAVVAADVDALLVATAVGAALVSTALLGTVAGQTAAIEVESKNGVDITIDWATANSPASGTQVLSVPYVLAG